MDEQPSMPGRLVVAAAVACFTSSAGARGGFVAYTAHAAQNSIDWSAGVEALGAARIDVADFETHPDGPLVPGFYQGTMGMTFGLSAGSVAFSSGSATGTIARPVSEGEGEMPPSRVLIEGGLGIWIVTLNFDEPVVGVGILSADLFNPWNDNALTLTAFDGPNGTGNNLGSAVSLAFCFQLNFRYFIGVADGGAADARGRTAPRIRSVVLGSPSLYSDTVYIEEIRVARGCARPIGDFNGDCAVDGDDLGTLLGSWGDCDGCPADLDGNGVVDGSDLGELLGHWS